MSSLKQIYRIDRREFALSMLATLGVVAVGAIGAIVVVVALATLRFVKLMARPKVEILGQVEELPGFHSVERHPRATTIPGLLLFRFNAPIVFFNADYFKREILAAARAAGPDLKFIVVDMLPVTMIDATGIYTAQEFASELARCGVSLAAAGRQTEWSVWAQSRKVSANLKFYPTLRAALKAFRSEGSASSQ